MTRRQALGLLALSVPALVRRAEAHGFLERSDPRGGSIVKPAPGEVRFWFTGRIEPAYSGAEVLTDKEQRVDVGPAVVDAASRKSLTVAVPALPPGQYRVKWRVLSVDGHVTEGAFTFRVAP